MNISEGKITHKINILAMTIDRQANLLLRDRFSIGYSEFIILVGLTYIKDASQKEIVEFSAISKAMVSRMISKLKKNNYVKVRTSKADKREDRVNITKSGKNLTVRASKFLENVFIENTFHNISQKDLKVFERILDSMIDNFKTN